MQRHEVAQIALDCALHGLPEPGLPWRNQIPAQPFKFGPGGRGFLGSGRSANIDTMIVAAWVCFVATGVAPKKERGPAVAMAADLLEANRVIFMLNEFGSTTYSGWTLIGWGSIAWALSLMGEERLAAGFRELITEWLALARTSMAPCPVEGLHVNVKYTSKGGKQDVLDESRHAGRQIVTICGERSWGHGHGLVYSHHTIARVAFGMERERPARQLPDPGRLDGWQERAIGRLAALFTACAGPAALAYGRSDWEALARLLKYPSANPCELRCYEDGSRIFIEGGDEPEPVDEDNSNATMRLALLAVYRTPPCIVSLPAWPAPNTGDTRIRSQAVWSDIDRDVHGDGWVLFHSLVGQIEVDGKWLSKATDPTSALIARYTCFGAGDGWALTGPREAGASRLVSDSPRPPRRTRRSWWRRFLGID